MSCLNAFEIDLPGFLAGPREDEFATFRDHYPRCPECSAEVRAWTELDDQLRRRAGSDSSAGVPASQHPPASLLVGYGDDPSALGASERRELERHLTACLSCRDELRTLGRFSPEQLAVGAPATATSRGPRLGPWLASLGRLAWHPAVAYALLILILVPTWLPTLSDRMQPGPTVAPSPLRSPSPRSSPRGEDRTRSVAVLQRETVSDDLAEEVAAVRKSASSLRRISIPAVPPTPVVAQQSEPAPNQVKEGLEKQVKGGLEKLGETRNKRERAVAGAERLAARGLASPSPATAADSAVPMLRLKANRTVDITVPSIRGEIRLRIPVPGDWGGEREVQIRVIDSTDRRELREARAHEPGATEVEIAVPVAWLAPGMYRVELVASISGSAAAFAFRVP